MESAALLIQNILVVMLQKENLLLHTMVIQEHSLLNLKLFLGKLIISNQQLQMLVIALQILLYFLRVEVLIQGLIQVTISLLKTAQHPALMILTLLILLLKMEIILGLIMISKLKEKIHQYQKLVKLEITQLTFLTERLVITLMIYLQNFTFLLLLNLLKHYFLVTTIQSMVLDYLIYHNRQNQYQQQLQLHQLLLILRPQKKLNKILTLSPILNLIKILIHLIKLFL